MARRTEDGQPKCDVYWRSHGCGLPKGHPGDSLSHECDPCPPDCKAPPDEDMLMGNVGEPSPGKPWMADCCGMCSAHCGDRPTYQDRLYGDDVANYPTRTGMPS